MFERQWHHPLTQVGLCANVRRFESLVLERQFGLAAELLFAMDDIPVSYKKRQFRRLQWLEKRKLVLGRKNIVHIYFHGFWPNMDRTNCQLLDLIRASSPNLQVVSTDLIDDADILFQSCYTNILPDHIGAQALRLIFLGENVRPSYTTFDYSFSFDMSSYLGRNIYLPLWLLELDWFDKGAYPDRITRPLSSISKGFTYDPCSRNGKIVYIGNNSEPHRISVIEKIEQAGFIVDRYGSHTRPVEDKHSLYKQYSLALTFENSYNPGYITEKLVHAFQSRIPAVYYGCLDSSHIKESPFVYTCYPYDRDDLVIGYIGAHLKSKEEIYYPPLVDHEEAKALFQEVLVKTSKIISQFS